MGLCASACLSQLPNICASCSSIQIIDLLQFAKKPPDALSALQLLPYDALPASACTAPRLSSPSPLPVAPQARRLPAPMLSRSE